MVAFQIYDFDSYIPGSWGDIQLDNGFAYWVAISKDNTGLAGQLFWYPLISPDEDIMVADFRVPSGNGVLENILKFDVDDEYVLIWPRYRDAQGIVSNSQLILLNSETGKVQHFETGLRIFDAQIIHQGE